MSDLLWNAVFVFFSLVCLPKSFGVDPVYMCNEGSRSKIYCQGGEDSILHTVLVEHHLYEFPNDTKDFVDSSLKFDPDVVLENFKKVNKSSRAEVTRFLDDNFNPPGDELEQCSPRDWTSNPTKFLLIKDPRYLQWAKHLNTLWKDLCKKMKTSVALNEGRHSMIALPYEFVAPGDRFREPYYWDSYWILKGLMVSEMYSTAKHMILNLASMCEKYGFVPNGGRIYYLQRSQPPFLIPMAYDYITSTGDFDFLKATVTQKTVLEVLQMEFDYWNSHAAKEITLGNGNRYKVYQYTTKSNTPRPESYDIDIRTASFTPEQAKPALYNNIARTAASGLDFSCKWLSDCLHLNSSKMTEVVPVELNSYICQNSRMLSFLYRKNGDQISANNYQSVFATMKRTVRDVFWNEHEKVWLDYHLDTRSHSPKLYITSMAPLFTSCYDRLDTGKVEMAYDYFERKGALRSPGGVPVSIIPDGQQWDFPFAWPPMVHMFVTALRTSRNARHQELAFKVAEKWLRGNYLTWQHTGHMFEKYNVTSEIGIGDGGEYVNQKGFGWTNGVVLDLLYTYGSRLEAPTNNYAWRLDTMLFAIISVAVFVTLLV